MDFSHCSCLYLTVYISPELGCFNVSVAVEDWKPKRETEKDIFCSKLHVHFRDTCEDEKARVGTRLMEEICMSRLPGCCINTSSNVTVTCTGYTADMVILHLHTTEGPHQISLPLCCNECSLTPNITSHLSHSPRCTRVHMFFPLFPTVISCWEDLIKSQALFSLCSLACWLICHKRWRWEVQ